MGAVVRGGIGATLEKKTQAEQQVAEMAKDMAQQAKESIEEMEAQAQEAQEQSDQAKEEADQISQEAQELARQRCASKEARETHYWLRLLRDSDILSEKQASELINESKELIKMLTSIVKTGRSNLGQLKTENS